MKETDNLRGISFLFDTVFNSEIKLIGGEPVIKKCLRPSYNN